jgi:SAM-dependent methyltransferase
VASAFSGSALTADDVDDLQSFGWNDRLAAQLELEAAPDHRAFMAMLRRFSERSLPSRGWLRVLEAGAGGGTRTILLAERGYDVTVLATDELERRFVEHRLERRGLHAEFVDRSVRLPRRSFDAVVAYEWLAITPLLPCLRRRGRFLSGPAFHDSRRRSARTVPSLDQLARHEPVLRLLRELGGGTVVDVGSGSTGLAPWLGAEWSVTALDRSFDDYSGAVRWGPAGVRRVVGDARALPFDDEAFDAAVAVDLLEHIAPHERRGVLDELCRVSRRRVVIACPAGGQALAADRRLADFYRGRELTLPGWLEEHLANGFPEPPELAARLGRHGVVQLIGNENARTHERVMRAQALPVAHQAARVLAWWLTRGGARISGSRLLRGGDRAPTYRTIAVVDLV